jgi:hypothetical protein
MTPTIAVVASLAITAWYGALVVDAAKPPALVPMPFVPAGLAGLDCSWVHRPDGNLSLLYASDDGMHEVLLHLNASPSGALTWGTPSPAVPLPVLNGTVKLGVPRGQLVGIALALNAELNTPMPTPSSSSSSSTFRFAGLVDAYPLGTTRLNGEWNSTNNAFLWDTEGLHRLVWSGYDGGGIRNVVVVRGSGQPTSVMGGASTSSTAEPFDTRSHRMASNAHGIDSVAMKTVGVGGGDFNNNNNKPRLFAAFQANRVPGATVVASNVTAVVTDDLGNTWHTISSHVTAPIPLGSKCYGAVEPSSVQLPNGTLWLLFRTQTGLLWETSSNDGGNTLAAGTPSRFR